MAAKSSTVDTNIINKIPAKKLKKLMHDPELSAKAMHLRYVSDHQPGIERKGRAPNFKYFFKGEQIKDQEILQRIKHLVIPPAWTNVWICEKDNGHLQVTGIDVRGRKQYKYHELWNALRNHTKFYRMIDFGKALPNIREQVNKDLACKELNERKILATVLSLMEQTNIRIGNEVYEKLYGSFGLTTLKNKHVTINGGTLKFSFKGKKGVEHVINLKNRKLASIVQKTKEIPGKELFQYYDDNGNKHPIDSGMLNDYIKEISGSNFTAKDFRTWAGTVNAFLSLKECGESETASAIKKNIVTTLDKVAALLGNTRAVCKKYYIHPDVFNFYENHTLRNYFKKYEQYLENKENGLLSPEEEIIMAILQKAYHS